MKIETEIFVCICYVFLYILKCQTNIFKNGCVFVVQCSYLSHFVILFHNFLIGSTKNNFRSIFSYCILEISFSYFVAYISQVFMIIKIRGKFCALIELL